MSKVDVAVQSYMKPESLLYTLMTLKEQSGALIDTVYINDDCSAPGVVEKYRSAAVQEYFHPWKIKVRVNTHRTKWGPGFVRGYWPRHLSVWRFLKFGLINLYSNGRLFYDRENIRYQWALEQSDKEWVYLIHDDIEFTDDVVKLYLDYAQRMTNPAIIGDLGQCWFCRHFTEEPPCNRAKIMEGIYPSEEWPITGVGKKRRACRINEWSCMVSTRAARDIAERERAFFGNYDDFGDVGAYWFDRAIALGYSFADPITDSDEKLKFYLHGWQGHSGHAVWVNQGDGKVQYQNSLIEQRMQEKFGVVL
ncbi:hypothetical protein [Geomonas propionica]|uniref:Glycosyl transferase family 2 n=1 Tax=Geomonas propionica TaxID=2798582 RepID=A0ABS0YWW4_9BACT|nr:hypothetical protein [Geomonas propionica]MBJ6802444.1 hypothetical protein [Geomonas propionica]